MASLDAESNDFDNPWESAANDVTYRYTSLRANEQSTSSSDAVAAAPAEGEERPMSLKNRCIWWTQLFDGFISALFIIFSFFLYHKRKVDASTTHIDVVTLTLMVLSILPGGILLARSVIGRRIFHFNMSSRPILVLLYLVTAIVLFADAGHLPSWIRKLQLERKEVLPICLVLFAALEVLVFFVLRHCHLSELEDIRDAENLAAYTSGAGGRSPWWWTGRSRSGRRDTSEDLEERLLFGQPSWTNTSNSRRPRRGQVQDGGANEASSTTSLWWPFPRGQDARDDGSVDYASLNEDWASRSEADPYWWSRDGDGN